MILGTVAAIAHGLALPFSFILFGDIIDAFINQAASASLVDPDNGNIIDCAAEAVRDTTSELNITTDLARERYLNVVATSDVDCDNAAYGVTLKEVFDTCFSDTGECLSTDEFIDTINVVCLVYAGIGVGLLIIPYLQISLFQLACERQVHKIRLLFYRAVLRQNIGWFDANPSGELSSRLSE